MNAKPPKETKKEREVRIKHSLNLSEKPHKSKKDFNRQKLKQEIQDE